MQEKIVEHLKSKYNPLALILYGSRASGKARQNSDWDFGVVVEQRVESDSEIINGQFVDADIIALPISPEELIKTFDGTLQTAKVVFDTDDVGKKLISDVQAIYTRGRNLSEQEKSNRINFFTRRLRKLEDNVNDPGVFFYHLGVFFEKALQYWFELKNDEWRTSPGTALRVIQERDPSYSKLLEVLSSQAPLKEKLGAAVKIFNHIIPK